MLSHSKESKCLEIRCMHVVKHGKGGRTGSGQVMQHHSHAQAVSSDGHVHGERTAHRAVRCGEGFRNDRCQMSGGGG